MRWLAQATVAEICGEDEEANWLCEEVLRRTGNETLAEAIVAGSTFLAILFIVVVAWVVSRLVGRLITRFTRRMEVRIRERLDRLQERGAMSDTARFRTRRFQRLHAVAGAMRGAASVVIWTIALFTILARLGVSLQPILAGAGLAGIVLGFGAQQLVRDVLAGISMLIEDQYGVGDWIEVEGKIGMVERVGLRSTAYRDLDGVVHHQLNGSIQRVGNLSQHWARSTFDVPVALDADVPAVKALIHKIATDLAEDPVWGEDIIGPPELWGVQEFGPEGLKIRVVIPTKPLRNWDVTRQLRERLKFAFERASIRMPSQLVEVGGQRYGYALLHHELEDEEPEHRSRRRGLVPSDAGPLDRPPTPAREPATEGAAAAAADEVADGDSEALPDQTLQLRIQRGPQPRPD